MTGPMHHLVGFWFSVLLYLKAELKKKQKKKVLRIFSTGIGAGVLVVSSLLVVVGGGGGGGDGIYDWMWVC